MNKMLKAAAAIILGVCMLFTGAVSAYANGENIDGEPFFRAKAEPLDQPIKAGDEGFIEVYIENLGVGTIEDVYAESTPPEDIMLLDGTDSVVIRDGIYEHKKGYISLRYKARDRITSEKLVFNITLKYLSSDGSYLISTQVSFSVDAEISRLERTYPVVMYDFSLTEKEILPNTTYDATLKIKNIGTADMSGVFVKFTGDDSFILTGATGSAYIPEIKKDSEYSLPVKIKTLGAVASGRHDLSLSLKYSYVSGSEELTESSEESFTMFGARGTGGVPMPKMTLKTLDDPITAGQRYKYYLVVENCGGVDMENIRLKMSGSDSIILINATDTAYADKIEAGKTKSFLVHFQTSADMTNPNQSISAELTYSYISGGKNEQATETAVLSIDASVSGAPVVRIYGDPKNSSIKPNTEYSYTVTIRNFGDISVKDMYIDFTPSDSIYFLDGTEYAQVPVIKAGESAEVTIKFRTTGSISSMKQTITAAMNYSYGMSAAANHGEAQGAITLIASGASEGGTGAPNIIISSYDIGADQIAAGDTFNLDFDFGNTSVDTAVENIVLTVNAGGDLNIYGGANTFFFPSLAAAGSLHETVALRALPTAQTGTSQVSISFKYDYLEGGNRTTTTCEQTIFVPVYQPDKMTFSVQTPTGQVFAGNEAYINVSYMNKGRCDISNVKAEIIGDVGALSTSKVIGNVAPGASNSFDFIVTPYMSGECAFTILFTYDDANMDEVSREVPVSFMVEEMQWTDPGFIDDPGTIEEPTEEGGGFPWIILWIGIGVVVVGGVITIICVVRHKKKKKKLSEADIDWEDDVFDDTTKV